MTGPTFGRRGRLLALAGALALAGVGAAVAADAAAVVEKREAEMKKLGGAMKLLGATAKGEKPFGPETAAAAETVQAVAQSIPDLFAENVTTEKARAKPEVWTKRDEFLADAKALADASGPLVVAAKGTDAAALGAALQGAGKTCGTCHDTFREKED